MNNDDSKLRMLIHSSLDENLANMKFDKELEKAVLNIVEKINIQKN